MNAPSPALHQPEASAQDASISQDIAAFAAALDPESVPARVKENAKLHILDVIGTALAATRFDFSHRALAGLLALGEPAAHTIIGMPARLPLRDASLMNGILAHGLDYDDTHPGAIVHPSSSTFPCALAVAEKVDASGTDLIAAYVLGVDIATRVGITAAGAMHTLGFHTTGIAGHFGCVMAAGKLLGLDAQQLTRAQGLAGRPFG